MASVCLCLVVLFVASVCALEEMRVVLPSSDSASECKMPTDAYPPPSNTSLPWYTIDLDLPAQSRWTEVVTPLGSQIHDMVYQVIDILPKDLADVILAEITANSEDILNGLPYDWGEEVRGIAQAIDMDISAAILYQMAYELMGLCTSIVAQDSTGHIYHARNLDFGLFMGWDKQNETWALTEKLRPLLFNARFMKGGVNVYNATYYAGYIGLLTGMKMGGFSITVDTRFDENLDRGLIEWLKGNHSGHFLSLTTRDAMENNATYAEALETLNNTQLIGPAYIILGGNSAGEGAVITREEALSLNLWTLTNGAGPQGDSFFVLETNYDHWVSPPFFDNRVTPATDCMLEIGADNIDLPHLFNVLSGKPNLNMLTTYTTLMDVNRGRFEAYVQDCKIPCSPW